MKKKKFALLGVAALGVLTLASCGNEAQGGGKDYYLGTVDVCLNYSGKQGITLQASSFENIVENINYVQKDLLPTWKAFQDNVGVVIRDASDYSAKDDAGTYTKGVASGFKSEVNPNEDIDLFYNTTSNINTMGSDGKAKDLMPYVNAGKMPYFKAWMEKNPTMATALMKSGKVFYTPYFDGYQDVERMFIMDTTQAEKIIDTDATTSEAFSTKASGVAEANPAEKTGEEATNVLRKAKYTPYMDENLNFYGETKGNKVSVAVSVSGNATEIKVNVTDNIIKLQNELLNREGGATGKELAIQLQTYLNAVYGDNVGEGKVYSKLSEVYTSESAAYTADELIALMRVIKANPGVITGNDDVEVELLSPRGEANNRVDNIADFMQIWGIQGLTSKKDMLYINPDGKIESAAIATASFEGIDLLSAIYDEGLIMNQFYAQGTKAGTKYLDEYFGHTAGSGTKSAFMLYDYAASTGAVNDMVDGIGTNPTDPDKGRIDGYQDKPITGVRPVLPPLAYWSTKSGASYLDSIYDREFKTLTRYSEENRSLKSTSWCIPSNADNVDGALELMDYLMSPEGLHIQDFGPDGYQSVKEVDRTKKKVYYWTLGPVEGCPGDSPVMSSETKQMIANSGTDFWSFMRGYIGSTHGVGHVRETAIQIQSCNAYAQVGLKNLEAAMANGVVVANRVDKNPSGYTWDTTVPTAGYQSVAKEKAAEYAAITAFWASDKCTENGTKGWTTVVNAVYGTITDSTNLGKTADNEDYDLAAVKNQKDVFIANYLYKILNTATLGLNGCIPAYAIPAAE